MRRFRGSDETLDREIRALEQIAQVRLRRAARELHELDRDLRELKAERGRRRALTRVRSPAEVPATA